VEKLAIMQKFGKLSGGKTCDARSILDRAVYE